MYVDSRIGHNIIYLAYKRGFYTQDVIKLTCTDIINRVYDEWKSSLRERGIRKGSTTSKRINVCKSLVRFVFPNTVYIDSRIGQNIIFYAHKKGFYNQHLCKVTCYDNINREYHTFFYKVPQLTRILELLD